MSGSILFFSLDANLKNRDLKMRRKNEYRNKRNERTETEGSKKLFWIGKRNNRDFLRDRLQRI